MTGSLTVLPLREVRKGLSAVVNQMLVFAPEHPAGKPVKKLQVVGGDDNSCALCGN